MSIINYGFNEDDGIRPNTIIYGDCLEYFKYIKSDSVDLVLCDLPYEVTACSWDSIIPIDILWNEWSRVLNDNGTVVLTAVQPFTTKVISSNISSFKYCWIWKKPQGVDPFQVKNRPLNDYEDIAVFHIGKRPIYNPQLDFGKGYSITRDKKSRKMEVVGVEMKETTTVNDGFRFPKRVLEFDQERGIHPTQKPVPLFEYLIRTYTNENAVVLDNCLGSGTSAIAALRSNRKIIGFEKEKQYFNEIKGRINEWTIQDNERKRLKDWTEHNMDSAL